ncbi:MAG: hypothetical protein ACRC5T_04650 [Cetobacterium sp.]
MATFLQYTFATLIFYYNRTLSMWWWALPTSTGVLFYRMLLGEYLYNFSFINIIILSTFFGLPFAYLCLKNSFEENSEILESVSLDCNKKWAFLTLELPICFSTLKNIISISFLATWFKINVIIPFNNGGLMYSNSNIETYNYYENMATFNLKDGMNISIYSLLTGVFFTLIVYGGLSAINNNNYIYKFFMFFYSNNFFSLFRRKNKKKTL